MIILNKTLNRLILAAMFAALTYVATTFIRIPAPLGYINLGDCFVIVGAFVLGPVYGALAGGIGSMLSDLFGYPIFAPGTLVIKAAMGFVAALIGAKLAQNLKGSAAVAARIAAAVAAELIMVAGYFVYEIFLYGVPAAAAEIPANLIQGAAGLITAVVLFELLDRTKVIARITK